jgi:hypothetical protein
MQMARTNSLSDLPINCRHVILSYLKNDRNSLCCLRRTCKRFCFEGHEPRIWIDTLGREVPEKYVLIFDNVRKIVLSHIPQEHRKLYKSVLDEAYTSLDDIENDLYIKFSDNSAKVERSLFEVDSQISIGWKAKNDEYDIRKFTRAILEDVRKVYKEVNLRMWPHEYWTEWTLTVFF